MLKNLKLKNKMIPIPLPIHNLEEAVNWLKSTFGKNQNVITQIKLDGKIYDPEFNTWLNQIHLNENSCLEIEMDSPKDLALEVLDSVRNLAYGIEKLLKELAVECWNSVEKKTVKKLLDIEQDLSLMLELIDHLNGIFDFSLVEMAPVNGLAKMIDSILTKLRINRLNSKWQDISKILLNHLEPFLKEMVSESEELQMNALITDLSLQNQKTG